MIDSVCWVKPTIDPWMSWTRRERALICRPNQNAEAPRTGATMRLTIASEGSRIQALVATATITEMRARGETNRASAAE